MNHRIYPLLHFLNTSIVIVGLVAVGAAAQDQSLSIFTGQSDIGNPQLTGSAKYDSIREEFEITGSGTNMWAKRDECHFVWKRMQGDFVLRARMKLLCEGVDPHRKIGWMARSSLEDNSAHASVALHGDGLTSLQFRRSAGDETEEVQSSVSGPAVIQLERTGHKFKMSVARPGEMLVSEEIDELNLGEEVYVGLFVCSHNPEVIERAKFDNVRVIEPANDEFVPYQDYIGSNLEILDVESRHRTQVCSVEDSLQAPNWTRDGKALIYNRNGRLFRFDLATRTTEPIDTDFATSNNNDHALSFDGKTLAISHQDPVNQGRSVIYTLPVTGGTPQQVTSGSVASYLHGWSPDGKALLMTGVRDDKADIYMIPSEGGPELQLTSNAGFNDGSEFGPDGKSIYFNSSRSGSMEIWCMNPDGSSPRQLTDDLYNNWFPHVSPDGKWIAFISFPAHVATTDHPFYEHVMLRLMPTDKGKPKVIAYVYGGQGTINVPSWSPDSRSLAFVSNTD